MVELELGMDTVWLDTEGIKRLLAVDAGERVPDVDCEAQRWSRKPGHTYTAAAAAFFAFVTLFDLRRHTRHQACGTDFFSPFLFSMVR